MKIRMIFIPSMVITMLGIFVVTSAYGKLKPDQKYYNERTAIDSISQNGNYYLASKSYISLNRNYNMLGTDIIDFIRVSYLGKNYKGFEISCSLLNEISFEPIDEVVPIYIDSTLYGEFSIIVDKIKRKKKDTNLNNASIILITSLLQSDIDARLTPFEFYCTPESVINYSDSVRFTRFCTYLKKNKFPGNSISGVYSGQLQPFLYHCTGLGMDKFSDRNSDLFIKWLELADILYTACLEGEMDIYFYKNQILGSIKYILEKNNRKDDYDLFKKYEFIFN